MYFVFFSRSIQNIARRWQFFNFQMKGDIPANLSDSKILSVWYLNLRTQLTIKGKKIHLFYCISNAVKNTLVYEILTFPSRCLLWCLTFPKFCIVLASFSKLRRNLIFYLHKIVIFPDCSGDFRGQMNCPNPFTDTFP